MPISSTDIKYYLSGGSGNSNANASLGGVVSTTQITSGGLNNIFDNISGAENASGDTEYRCIYVKNTHATLTLQGTKVYITTQTPSPDTVIEIGLGSSAINGTEQTVANEGVAPSTITYTALTGSSNALTIGDLAAGATKALWIKRIVAAGGAAYNNDGFTIQVDGETAA